MFDMAVVAVSRFGGNLGTFILSYLPPATNDEFAKK